MTLAVHNQDKLLALYLLSSYGWIRHTILWLAEVQKLEGDRVTQGEDVEFLTICLAASLRSPCCLYAS